MVAIIFILVPPMASRLLMTNLVAPTTPGTDDAFFHKMFIIPPSTTPRGPIPRLQAHPTGSPRRHPFNLLQPIRASLHFGPVSDHTITRTSSDHHQFIFFSFETGETLHPGFPVKFTSLAWIDRPPKVLALSRSPLNSNHGPSKITWTSSSASIKTDGTGKPSKPASAPA